MLPSTLQELKNNFLYIAGPEVADLEEPKKNSSFELFYE